MQLKKSLWVILLVSLCAQSAQAAFLSILLGPRLESYSQKNQSERSRTSPMSVFMELGVKIRPNWYLAVGTSGEFDVGEFATTGFTLTAFAKYFFIGVPELVSTVGKDARLQLALPYTVFAGLGLFQKNVKFNSTTQLNVDENLGGLGLSFGGSYNITKKYFIISQVNYLISGLSSDTTYTSAEVYGGMGFRF